MLHLSIFVRLFHRQSFALYGITDYPKSIIEENAIYYAAGYVVRKILHKYRKANDDKGAAKASSYFSQNDR